MRWLTSQTRPVRICYFRTFVAGILLVLALTAHGQTIAPAARGKIMDAIKAKYKSLKALAPKPRGDATVAFMKTFKEIKAAKVSEDGNVCCIFNDHMSYSILLSSQPSPDAKQVAVLPTPQYQVSESNTPDQGQPLFVNTNLAFGRVQAGLANDLPGSTKARLLTALGPAFGDAHVTLRNLLQARGYQVDPGYDATIDRLKIADKPGFFYVNCHGGLAYFDEPTSKFLVMRYCLSTSDMWTPAREAEVVRDNLIKDGLVSVSDVVYDTSWVVLPVEKRVFMISEAFIKRFWRFGENSAVVISACNSNKLAETLARYDVHASLACLWDNFCSPKGDMSVLFAVDRLLGANDNAVTPQEQGYPQRPFDYKSIERDMKRKNNLSHQLTYKLNRLTATLKFSQGFDNFGLLAPSIKCLLPVPYQRKLELVGMFGKDPGTGNRKVTINQIAMVVDKWEPDKITILLPNQSVHGEVKVIHMGRESNTRWLGNWVGTINLSIQGAESLALKADFGVNLVGDPWSYREQAGDKPVDPMVWSLFSPIGSDCTWSAAGEEKDSEGKVRRKWSGGGTPKPWLDENMGTKGTFGVGGVGDSYQRLVTIYPAIVDTFDLTESGTTNPVPVKLGDWLQGQTMFQVKYDRDFGFLGDSLTIADEPSRLSYGGLNAVLKWSSMQCRTGMPRNAAR